MQGCFKIDLGSIRLSDVKILCLKARAFLMTIVKWGMSGQGYKQLSRFSRLVLSKPAACTIQEINPVLIFVTKSLKSVSCMRQITLTQSGAPVELLAGPNTHTSTQYIDFVEILKISLDLSTIYFAHFGGC